MSALTACSCTEAVALVFLALIRETRSGGARTGRPLVAWRPAVLLKEVAMLCRVEGDLRAGYWKSETG